MKFWIKKYFLLIAAWSFSVSSYTQISLTDSLKNLFDQNPHDTIKVYLLYKISDQYFNSTVHDTAMQFAREAYDLAKEIGFEKGEARSLTRMGNIYEATGDFPTALETHLEALKISEGMNDLVGIGAADNNIARVCTEQKTPDDFKKAIDYYRKAKDIFEKLKDNKKLSTALMNIGDNFEKMGKLDSAWFYQEQAYQMSLLSDDINQIGITLVNLGYIHLKNKEFDSAFNKLRSGIYYLNESEDWESLPDAWNSLSECFEKIGGTDSAILYAKRSFAMAENGFNKQAQLDAADQLANLYGTKKSFDSAYRYSNLATKIRSDIYNNEKAGEIQRTYAREQLRQQKLEQERIVAEKKRKDNLQIIAISGFIITFFVVLIILSQKKINPRAIEVLGVLGLLLVFEFITIFIHPFIGDLTHHTPVYMLAILVLIAAILGPMHHNLTKWLKQKLVRRTTPAVVEHSLVTATEHMKSTAQKDPSHEHDEKKVSVLKEDPKLIIKVPPQHQTHSTHKKGNKKGKH